MLNKKSHFGLAVVLVAAVMIVAGGVVTASNTGFKLNKPLEPVGAGGLPAGKGNNWVSIPYFNPYSSWRQFCIQTGLISSGAAPAQDLLLETNPATGGNVQATCGAPAALTNVLTPGRGIRVRRPGSITTQTSIIIVGSHNPSLTVSAPAGVVSSHIGDFWFAVPYHTTAVTAADLCAQAGLWGASVPRATVTRVNAVTGANSLVQCGTATASTLNLVLGEAVMLRDPHGPVSFVPAHF